MTKWIAILIVAVVLYCGWELFLYWDKVQHEEETSQKQAAASVVTGESLGGVPWQLENSLRAAQSQGLAGLRAWLKAYGRGIEDPRKAWIELDYCLMLSREDPAEARRLFAEIKKRTSPSSPVWPRIKQLEKTYE
jgi:hypothetical protein